MFGFGSLGFIARSLGLAPESLGLVPEYLGLVPRLNDNLENYTSDHYSLLHARAIDRYLFQFSSLQYS